MLRRLCIFLFSLLSVGCTTVDQFIDKRIMDVVSSNEVPEPEPEPAATFDVDIYGAVVVDDVQPTIIINFESGATELDDAAHLAIKKLLGDETRRFVLEGTAGGAAPFRVGLAQARVNGAIQFLRANGVGSDRIFQVVYDPNKVGRRLLVYTYQ